MGKLDKLDISNRIIDTAKRRTKIDTVEYRRQNLIANTEEQIELAGLALEGKELILQRNRGSRVVTVRPRIWWAVEPDGVVFVQIRYNKIALNLADRGTTICVGTWSNSSAGPRFKRRLKVLLGSRLFRRSVLGRRPRSVAS